MSLLEAVNTKIKSCIQISEKEILSYNSIVINKLMPLKYITYNSVILLTIQLLNQNPKIKEFYSDYYPLIIVDEFQDTNCIAWKLLQTIISPKTKLLFLGDPLQRIYGFIGASPSLMDEAEKQYNMKRISLSKNYRFGNNKDMMLLEKNLRINALSEFTEKGLEEAVVPAFWGKNQCEEVSQVVSKVSALLSENSNSKVALLLRKRSNSIGIIENELQKASLDYFYGMFTDEDVEYIRYNEHCQKIMNDILESSKNLNIKSLKRLSKEVKRTFVTGDERVAVSLNRLLDALIEKVINDYAELTADEKLKYIHDVFENRQLKQAMEYVSAPIILSTIHAAKGLEWDYVFIIDLEKQEMPGYYTCVYCPNMKLNKLKCNFPDTSCLSFRKKLIEELSVFYVAITRARKQVFVSASHIEADDKWQRSYSCFSSLPGIKLVNALLNSNEN